MTQRFHGEGGTGAEGHHLPPGVRQDRVMSSVGRLRKVGACNYFQVFY